MLISCVFPLFAVETLNALFQSPTIVDIATGSVPPNWDGTSFKDVLFNVSAPRRQYELMQYFGEGQTEELCGSLPGYFAAPCDQWNNTYSCLRSIIPDRFQDDIYCTFKCYNNAHEEVPCPSDQPEGYGEYYDLVHDPYQTRNGMLQLTDPEWYITRLNTLTTCSGQAQCGQNLGP